MSDAVGNDLNREALGIGNRLLPALAIAHYARKLESLRDPAAIFLNLQVNRQLHSSILLPQWKWDLSNRPFVDWVRAAGF
jgi:hypothetical protein